MVIHGNKVYMYYHVYLPYAFVSLINNNGKNINLGFILSFLLMQVQGYRLKLYYCLIKME